MSCNRRVVPAFRERPCCKRCARIEGAPSERPGSERFRWTRCRNPQNPRHLIINARGPDAEPRQRPLRPAGVPLVMTLGDRDTVCEIGPSPRQMNLWKPRDVLSPVTLLHQHVMPRVPRARTEARGHVEASRRRHGRGRGPPRRRDPQPKIVESRPPWCLHRAVVTRER